MRRSCKTTLSILPTKTWRRNEGPTYLPRASSTSPRLGSRPRTRPLQVRGINSSAGYAWSWHTGDTWPVKGHFLNRMKPSTRPNLPCSSDRRGRTSPPLGSLDDSKDTDQQLKPPLVRKSLCSFNSPQPLLLLWSHGLSEATWSPHDRQEQQQIWCHGVVDDRKLNNCSSIPGRSLVKCGHSCHAVAGDTFPPLSSTSGRNRQTECCWFKYPNMSEFMSNVKTARTGPRPACGSNVFSSLRAVELLTSVFMKFMSRSRAAPSNTQKQTNKQTATSPSSCGLDRSQRRTTFLSLFWVFIIPANGTSHFDSENQKPLKKQVKAEPKEDRSQPGGCCSPERLLSYSAFLKIG